MLIIPAVDLKGSEVVRLYKGDFNKIERYTIDASETVREYLIAGVKRLHVIFLWGAHTGKLNGEEETLRRIIKIRTLYNSDCKIQVGGGIRKSKQAETFFQMGVDFVIMGTSLLIPLVLEEGFNKNDLKLFYQQGGKTFKEEIEVPEPDLPERIDEKMKERIIVAIDYRKDETALSGWEVTLPLTPYYVIKRLLTKGFKRFIITNVDRDGTLEGIETSSIKTILDKVSNATPKPEELIISGGVTTEEDIKTLQRLKNKPEGVIIGKALYQKKIDIQTVIKKFQ